MFPNSFLILATDKWGTPRPIISTSNFDPFLALRESTDQQELERREHMAEVQVFSTRLFTCVIGNQQWLRYYGEVLISIITVTIMHYNATKVHAFPSKRQALAFHSFGIFLCNTSLKTSDD